jgi:hypothetical protein
MKSKSEWTKMLPSVSTGIDGWNEIACMIDAVADDARRTALEEAAKVCDAYAAKSFEAAKKNPTYYVALMNQGEGSDTCADRVRALRGRK